MKLCVLAHAASIHTRRWASWFAARGHEVDVVSLTGAESAGEYRVHPLSSRRGVHQGRLNWSYLRLLPDLRRRLEELKPDLINAHFLTSNGVFGALTRPRGRPLVISVLGSDVLVIPVRAPLLRPALRWALRRASLVTSVADHLTQKVLDLGGSNLAVETVPFGVDESEFHAGLPPGERDPIILSTRRLESFARLDVLMGAVRKLRQENSPLRTRIVGVGNLRADLEREARSSPALQDVSFLGELTTPALSDELQRAAIYVSLTATDGASLSLLEAMACGAFPVVTDIPANREWIEHGANGFLVPLGAPEDTASAIRDAWADPGLRQRASARNAELVWSRADRGKNMLKIEAYFEELVRRAPNG